MFNIFDYISLYFKDAMLKPSKHQHTHIHTQAHTRTQYNYTHSDTNNIHTRTHTHIRTRTKVYTIICHQNYKLDPFIRVIINLLIQC